MFLARAREQELRATAGRRRPLPEQRPSIAEITPVTLRFAFPDDAGALARLAALDCSEPPLMPTLLAEVGGQLRAARSLANGSVIADPFHPTVALVELLNARARQLTRPERPRRLRLRRVAWLSSRSARG
jgi:hypothetical protein